MGCTDKLVMLSFTSTCSFGLNMDNSKNLNLNDVVDNFCNSHDEYIKIICLYVKTKTGKSL